MKERIDILRDELVCYIPNEFIVTKPERIPGDSLKEQNAAKHLPANNPLAQYITICYEGYFSFVSDSDGAIECSYEIPRVVGLSCSDEVNALIVSGFRNYVTAENNNSYNVHFDTPYLFMDTFIAERFTTSADRTGNILTEYNWEANIYNDILSIRITRTHYNPGNPAFLFEPEYDVINIDLLTGQIVKSEDVLWMIGIEEWDLQERIRNGIYELFNGFYDEDKEIFLQNTFYENPYSAILERGFYLSPDGVQVWVYAYMSKYGYKYLLTLGI